MSGTNCGRLKGDALGPVISHEDAGCKMEESEAVGEGDSAVERKRRLSAESDTPS